MNRAKIIFLLCPLVMLAQKDKVNIDKGNKSVLEITYTNSNNMGKEAMDKSFENSSGLSEEAVRAIKATVLNASNRYLLFVDAKTFHSVYEKDPSFIPKANTIDDDITDFTVFNASFVYKNGNVFSFQPELGNTQRFFLKDIPPLKWKITKETKKIGDWTCTKAVPEGDFMPFTAEVWFTGDVPIPCGPMHYFGLPGLVVEVVIPEIARITFYGMKYSDKGKDYVKNKAETYRRELEKKKEKTTSWEEVKAQFGLIAKQMGH